ncbi:MAG: efflux RND transporter periplasmic adaptor subunit [Phycisphaerales bacterium]|nr:efflux RND transporter periplasmic adaptor subunit [Phycisphaerales bacterium]
MTPGLQPRGRRLMVPVGLALSVLIGGCKPSGPATYAPPPPPDVTVATPEIRKVPETLEYTGTTRGVEEVEIRARVKGFLQEKHVENGRRVTAGELLFTIDPRPFDAMVKQAEAEVASARAQVRLAEVTLERISQALASNAVSKQDEDKAKADRDAAQAKADLAAAQLAAAKLDLEFTQIKSPIDGRIGFIDIDEGQLVGAQDATLLARVINDAKVYATYEMPDTTVLKLREKYQNRRPGEDGRPNLTIELQQPGEKDFPHRGQFSSGDNAVNQSTGTIRIEAIFDNPGGTILPGAFVRVRALFGEREAMLVPDVAVMTDQGRRYVLVVDAAGTVERREVEIGARVGQSRVIERGLKSDDRVVVNGLQRARPGAKVNPVKAGA